MTKIQAHPARHCRALWSANCGAKYEGRATSSCGSAGIVTDRRHCSAEWAGRYRPRCSPRGSAGHWIGGTRQAIIEGLPPYLDGWDIIEVPLAEAHFIACNGLPIDPDNYILGYNDTVDGSRVQSGLEAHGITVHRIAYGNHTEDGGSIRCSTHPLVRRLA